MQVATHKETGDKLYIISSRTSYGGIIVYECVTYEVAEKYDFKVPHHIYGLYFAGSLILH